MKLPPPHPSKLINQVLEQIPMSKAELAIRLGYSTSFVYQLCKFEQKVNPILALKLERVLWVNADILLEMQRARDEYFAAMKKESTARLELAEMSAILSYKKDEILELFRRAAKDTEYDLYIRLLKFLKVSDLTVVENLKQYKEIFRDKTIGVPECFVQCVNVRHAELEAL